MKLKLIATLILTVGTFALGGMFEEGDWQVAFNNKVTHGKLEVATPTGRIDILTDTHVIEVDHARNYRAGIKQALQYAGATRKKPGLAIVMDGTQDTLQAVEAAKKLCQESDVSFWLINEYVSVNELAELKPQKAMATRQQTPSAPQSETNQTTRIPTNASVTVTDPADQKPQQTLAAQSQSSPTSQIETTPAPKTQTYEQGYWLNSATDVRHNRSCRWFGNTTTGKPCGPDQGRACKECGG